MPSTNKIHWRVLQKDWTSLLKALHTENGKRMAGQENAFGDLPIHLACYEGQAPPHVIRGLLAVYPEGVHHRNMRGFVPLELARVNYRSECPFSREVLYFLEAYSAEDGNHNGATSNNREAEQEIFQPLNLFQLDTVCCVCLDQKADYVVLPCGHECLCQECANLLTSSTSSNTNATNATNNANNSQATTTTTTRCLCPVCRCPIKHIAHESIVRRPPVPTTATAPSTVESESKSKSKSRPRPRPGRNGGASATDRCGTVVPTTVRSERCEKIAKFVEDTVRSELKRSARMKELIRNEMGDRQIQNPKDTSGYSSYHGVMGDVMDILESRLNARRNGNGNNKPTSRGARFNRAIQKTIDCFRG
eukprot:jgi/Psemu1/48545/gm1.48545_g